MPTYVIINISSRFAQERGQRFEWVSEYPDATEYHTIGAARIAMRRLQRLGPCANIYSLIENYGLESQRTVQRLDALEQRITRA